MGRKRTEGGEASEEKWKHPAEFILAVLGYSIGMGTLTRFPFMVMKNGGGAFLIPFSLAMLFVGIPLFYLELILGQFSGRSPLTLYRRMMPAFKGIGYSMTLLTFIGTIYYMPFTWSIIYLCVSFTGVQVPWTTCENDWNTGHCLENHRFSNNNVSSNATTFPSISSNATVIVRYSSPAEEYFNEFVADIKYDGLETGLGEFKLHLVFAHLATFVLVFLCSFKGPVSAGKVVYVTATLPYLLLTILFIRGITLPGSLQGIVFFLKPDFTKLADVNVWIEAALQVVFQLGPAWGSLITMSRYNHFYHKCYREAVIIPVGNLLTAIYGGLAIFPILGHVAQLQGVHVADVAKSGPALAFVAYPEAIAQLPFPPFWSSVFFLMLITVAIDSQFAFFETVVSGFTDMIPAFHRHKITVAVVFAIILFLLGLPLCTQGGIFLWQLLDWYGAPLTFISLGFLEIVAIAFVYGLKRFRYDASLMFGKPPNTLVSICWFSITPFLMAVMTFFGLSNLREPTYKYTNYTYPRWAIAFGWTVAMTSFLPTPIMFIVSLVKSQGSLLKRFKTIFTPSDEWVPAEPRLVEDYRRHWHEKSVQVAWIETNTLRSLPDRTCIHRLKCFVLETFVGNPDHSQTDSNNVDSSKNSENNSAVIDLVNGKQQKMAMVPDEDDDNADYDEKNNNDIIHSNFL